MMNFLQPLRRSSRIFVNRTKFLEARKPSNAKCFSSIYRGQDLLAESLAFGKKRKIILDSYYPNTGIDVHGMLELPPSAEDEGMNNTILMNGSIIAFPFGCYLWKPRTVKEVTLESLSMVLMSKPSVEFLFIGCDEILPPREMKRIKKAMQKRHIVVEQMDVMNAMGTFNVLNGEDRRIAVAIVVGNDDE